MFRLPHHTTRTWASPPGFAAHLQAAHLHTTRPACLLLNTGLIKIKRKKNLKPLPLAENWEPFQISETLLDLDAYEAPGVRPFDATDAALQEEKWSAQDPGQKSRAKDLYLASRRFESAHSHYDRLSQRRHTSGKWRVSELDLIGAALFHPSDKASKISTDKAESDATPEEPPRAGLIARDLHEVLAKNGIPPLVEMGNMRMMEWLIERHKSTPPFTAEETRENVRHITGGADAPYLAWKRFIILLLNSGTDGCDLLTSYQDYVVDAFRAHYTNKGLIDLLVLIGHIRVRLEQEGIDIPGSFCQLGLAFATILNNHKAMESYLSIALVHQFKNVSPDPSLYDVHRLKAAVVMDHDGEVMVLETEECIRQMIMTQAARKGALISGPETDLYHGTGSESDKQPTL
ncbi:hypothetical protein B0T11DRAFT_2826 [Plectosphaerella cucumerina]|uniref:Uncharacterized protein n=1 Tax=Plectosphaerella cucumerina TaxID=40658 RepID=A0A8K0TR16_9PEZI|nr:hypothetical protein B0T11DRAFT_2826 [Plectosphaerella cucumerina]